MEDNVRWRPSPVTTVLVTAALALVGNLATGTVRIEAAWWTAVVWTLTGLLLVVSVITELTNRRAFTSTAADPLVAAADQLATAVERQWQAEAERRQINDQNVFPVPWRPAPASLVDEWSYVVAAGGPETVTSPADLAATDGRLAAMFRKVPGGRLVVLGSPGSGKTALLIRLVLDLLVHRRDAAREPVPVLLPLASWNPAEQDLHAWLLRRLAIDHPALAGPAPFAIGGLSLGEALLTQRLLLPILDGLDEMPPDRRRRALSAINDALHGGDRLVVSCRIEDYRAVADPPTGLGVKLRGAAGVVLTEPGVEGVRGYLRREAGGSAAADRRWAPVLAALGGVTAVGLALRSPLLISMASTIYNPRPGEDAGSLPDPAELCDTGRFATAERIEDHLFGAFLPAAYRRSRGWTAGPAERYLAFLARHLRDDCGGTTDLAWWQLRRSAPRRLFVVLWTGLWLVVVGVAALIAGLNGVSLAIALGLALGMGLVFGDVIAREAHSRFAGHAPRHGVRWSSGRLRLGLIAGVVAGLGWGLPIGHLAGAYTGFGVGIIFGSMAFLYFGIEAVEGAPANLARTADPRAVLAADRRTGLLIAGVWWLLVLALSTVGGLVAGDIRGGLGFGLAMGLVFAHFGVAESAWPLYAATRCWLAWRHHVPWRFAGFLADAHRRGVLRQNGAVYEFSHARLQQRLASR
jgi:NACHT domain